MIGTNQVFAAEPVEAGFFGVEDGVAIGARQFSAFRAMALADGPKFPVDAEADLPA